MLFRNASEIQNDRVIIFFLWAARLPAVAVGLSAVLASLAPLLSLPRQKVNFYIKIIIIQNKIVLLHRERKSKQ